MSFLDGHVQKLWNKHIDIVEKTEFLCTIKYLELCIVLLTSGTQGKKCHVL